MSLHNGIDTVAIATLGVYTSTYGAAAPGNIANLFASFGFYEDAPLGVLTLIRGLIRMGMALR